MGSETILPIITAVVLGGTLITGKRKYYWYCTGEYFHWAHAVWLANDGLTNEQSNVVIGIILILSIIMRHFKLHQFLAEKKKEFA